MTDYFAANKMPILAQVPFACDSKIRYGRLILHSDNQISYIESGSQVWSGPSYHSKMNDEE